jgi:hypothetical protein
MNQEQTKAAEDLFVSFAREVLRFIKAWASAPEPPMKPIRHFAVSEYGKLRYATDYRQIANNHYAEILDWPVTDQCARELLAKGIVRLPPSFDARTEQQLANFDTLKSAVVQQLLDPVLDLIEREGICPDDGQIISSFRHVAEPSWVTFVPLVNFTTSAPPTRVGRVFELGPFASFEKTALWDEYFLTQDGMISWRQFERATFRLMGGVRANESSPDFAGELRRIVTALRLLKMGRVGAPALFSKSSMLSTYGGSIGSLEDYAIHPSSIYGLFPRYELLASELSQFLSLYDDIRTAEDTKRLNALAVAIRRFNQAYARATAEDRIIDFCIALESSLLSDVREELRYRLSLRGAALLASEREPEHTRWLLCKIYDVRSAIVHDGKSLQQIMEKTPSFAPLAPSLDEICEDVVRNVLCAYIRRLAAGQSLKDVNEELERRLVARLHVPPV